MYHLSCCTMPFYDGMKFDSLAEAYAKQQKLMALHPHTCIDIMRDEDGKTSRVVCTSDSAQQNITLKKV